MARSNQKKSIGIRDASGALWSGQTVELKRGSTTITMTEVGTSGVYENASVPVGQWEVYVNSSANGETVPVGAGEVDVPDPSANPSSTYTTSPTGVIQLSGPNNVVTSLTIGGTSGVVGDINTDATYLRNSGSPTAGNLAKYNANTQKLEDSGIDPANLVEDSDLTGFAELAEENTFAEKNTYQKMTVNESSVFNIRDLEPKDLYDFGSSYGRVFCQYEMKTTGWWFVGLGSAVGEGDIFRSKNKGVSWELVENTGYSRCSALHSVIESDGSETLYAGFGSATSGFLNTLKRSLDGGDNWSNVTNYSVNVGDSVWDIKSDSQRRLYVASGDFSGTNAALKYSDDPTVSFSSTTGLPSEEKVDRILIDSDDNILLGIGGASRTYVYKSTDRGVSASNTNYPATSNTTIYGMSKNPVNGDISVVSGTTSALLYVSEDGGDDWELRFNGSLAPYSYDTFFNAIHSPDGRLFLGCGLSADKGNVLVSKDDFQTTGGIQEIDLSSDYEFAYSSMITSDFNYIVGMGSSNGDADLIKIPLYNFAVTEKAIGGVQIDKLRFKNLIRVDQDNFQEKLAFIDSTKVYFIDEVIDVGDMSIEIPAGGISLDGHNFDVSKIATSEPSHSLFTSPVDGSGNILIKSIGIEVTGTGSQVYDCVDATGFNAYEISQVNFNNCSSLGVLDGYRQGFEQGTGRFGGTPELELKGTWVGGYFQDSSIVRNITDGSYFLFKAGAGFTMASRFRSNANIDLNSSVGFFDFSSSNFTSPNTVQLNECIISRNGSFDATDSTLIPNISEGDDECYWKANTGIKNTYVGAVQKVTSESATSIASGSTFYDLNATWTASNMQHFDAPSNGELRHTGVNPIEFQVIIDLSLESITGNVLEMRIAKWSNATSSYSIFFGNKKAQVNALVGSRDIAFLTSVNTITLAQNEKFKIQIANNNGNNNITAEIDSFVRVIER